MSVSYERMNRVFRGVLGSLLLFGLFSTNVLAKEVLYANEWLMPGESLLSPNGKYQLVMQNDGNLVLYKLSNMQALWHTNTWMYPGLRAVMQGDGNFVLYDGWVDQGYYYAYWHANVISPGARLVLQNDGNLVIYRPDNSVPWHTNTPQPTGCYPTYGGFAMCILWGGGIGDTFNPFSFSPYDVFPVDYWTGQPCDQVQPYPYAGTYCFD